MWGLARAGVCVKAALRAAFGGGFAPALTQPPPRAKQHLGRPGGPTFHIITHPNPTPGRERVGHRTSEGRQHELSRPRNLARPANRVLARVGTGGWSALMSGVGRRWRHYETAAGRRPVKAFIDRLSDADKASVLAAMKEIRDLGLPAARHLQGEIYEVRADGDRVIYRVLFATEGQREQILLALEAFSKKTQRTPPRSIDTARRRLQDWRARGRP